jgi:hypothetical protein
MQIIFNYFGEFVKNTFHNNTQPNKKIKTENASENFTKNLKVGIPKTGGKEFLKFRNCKIKFTAEKIRVRKKKGIS